jgi:hypothetical protein
VVKYKRKQYFIKKTTDNNLMVSYVTKDNESIEVTDALKKEIELIYYASIIASSNPIDFLSDSNVARVALDNQIFFVNVKENRIITDEKVIEEINKEFAKKDKNTSENQKKLRDNDINIPTKSSDIIG